MPANPVIIDGLWRCLCPSADFITSTAIRTTILTPVSRSRSSKKLALKLASPCRNLYTSVRQPFQYQAQAAHRSGIRRDDSQQSTYQNLDEIPISQLHDTLRQLRAQEKAYHKITSLVHHLVNIRGEKPSLLLYDALIRANSDTNGSADVVANLLKEMKRVGIVPDSGLYHSVLQVLAVHPDYLLRNQILEEMKDRWYTLTPDGWHNLIVGLLREKQYEIALEKLGQMEEEGVKIHPWLYDIFIYLFCEAGELDEAVKILRYRVDSGDMDISANVWYFVLDACSKSYHYDGTLYVWRKRVETSFINPSDGMCANVLNTAARNHDAVLATDVVRTLASRISKLDASHYEALITAYIGSSDLKTSLRILCIMQKAGLEPGEVTTRPIFTYLSSDSKRPQEALTALEELHKSGHQVPISAANVIIEAAISQGHLHKAEAQYKAIHIICPSGPNTATFNALMQGCGGYKDIAMSLAAEMAALKVKPDLLTYDRLILVCLNESEEDYEDAFRYLEELRTVFKGEGPRSGTWAALVKRCINAEDERAWSLLDDMENMGHPAVKLKRWAEDTWKRSGNTLAGKGGI